MRWKLSGSAPSAQSLGLELRRDEHGRLEIVGWSEPAGSHLEVEISAGWTSVVQPLDELGRFHATGLPGDVRHLKVCLRGGTASPIVLPRLAAPDHDPS